EIIINYVTGKTIILFEQGQRARVEIEVIEIVPLALALVEGDNDTVGKARTGFEEPGLHAGKGGEGLHGLGGERYAEELTVLIAVLILDVEEVRAGVGPPIPVDAAAGVMRERLGLRGVVARRHPEIEHAVERG